MPDFAPVFQKGGSGCQAMTHGWRDRRGSVGDGVASAMAGRI